MRITPIALMAWLAAAPPAPAQDAPGAPLPTVAESSDYQATSTHAEVMAFLQELAHRSPRLHLTELGTTHEGRSIPLAILADPPVATAAEARASGKLLLFAFGNIHAGEVCGKEALCILAREIVAASSHPLLEHCIVLLAPIYNADGNERFSTEHRTNQVGPARGMGQRPNAQGLDLNREYVKCESPEARALLRFYRHWDPAVIIDTHTTNGSHHQYTLTYASPRHPAGDPDVIGYVRDRFLPGVTTTLEAVSGFKSFFYGNFDRDHTTWTMYPALPRYGTPFNGLRNRIAILSEAYAYASYKDRVWATKHFVEQCFRAASDQRVKIRALIAQARRRAIAAGTTPAPDDRVPLRTEPAILGDPVALLGFEEEERDGKRVPTDRSRTYTVEFFGQERPTLSVPRPWAYLLPRSDTWDAAPIVENLQRHGVLVDVVREDITVATQAYRIDTVERAEREFQGHRLVQCEATPRAVDATIPAGSWLVRTGQEHGALASLLLEPQSADGLVAWNFFDDALEVGADFPVLRLATPTGILRRPAPPLREDRPVRRPVTFDDVFGSPPKLDMDGRATGIVAWSADGQHFWRRKDGRLRRIQAATGREAAAVDVDGCARALAALPDLDRRTARQLAGRLREPGPTQTGFIVRHGGSLYYCRVDGGAAVRLASAVGAEPLATFSPDGRRVAFVAGNDLHTADVETATVRQLTTGGTDLRRNGRLDWVYFEELFHRSWRGYWWSPTSTHLAYLQLDDAPVGEFTVIDQIPVGQKRETTRYPKAGTANPRVQLGIVQADGGGAAMVDLSGYPAEDRLVTQVGFTPDGERVWFFVQDRAQTWLDVCVASLSGGRPTVLFRETTGAWVENDSAPEWLPDGSFLFPSERSGWRHLYHYAADGTLRGAVTSGEWEVRRVHRVDADPDGGGWIYLSGTRDSHIAQHLYRVRLDGSALERLTAAEGSHRVRLAPIGSLFVDTWSTADTPPQVALFRMGDDGGATRVRWLDTNPVPELDDYTLGAYRRFSIPMPDGFVCEASLLTPPDFDPTRRYPVWFMTYGGPHAPTIRGGWARRTLDELLAAKGIVVFRFDPRSASGKGAVSTWTAYKQLGVQELKDVTAAIAWLTQEPWVDGTRIGMSGHSYGGYLTAYCMVRSKLFAAGIAGAPVTDWANYDTIYTERYMDTPQRNAAGYAASSVVSEAKHLHGRLLIAHGAMDDNVHLQNTWQLVHALQKADKPFELMVYPRNRHGIRQTHYRRLMVDFIERALEPDR